MHVANIVGIVIVTIFIFFIFSKKGKVLSDYLLIIINLLCGLMLISELLVLEFDSRLIFILYAILPFYLFPFFLLYVSNMVLFNQAFLNKHLMYFLLAFSFTLFIGADLFYFNQDRSLELLFTDPSVWYHLFYKSNSILFIGILIKLIARLNRYSKVLKNNFSSTAAFDLSWLMQVSWMFLVTVLFSLCIFLLYNFKIVLHIEWAYVLFNISLVAGLFYMSFNGIRQYVVAQYILEKSNDPVSGTKKNINEPIKYKSSSLTSKDLNSMHQAILKLLTEEKLFLEPLLTIQELSSSMNVSVHALSQVINTLEKKPFYDFINNYRVDYFKNLLLDPENDKYTILGLAYDSGFNSKASFYRIFKSETNQTPSAYRKALHDKKAY